MRRADLVYGLLLTRRAAVRQSGWASSSLAARPWMSESAGQSSLLAASSAAALVLENPEHKIVVHAVHVAVVTQIGSTLEISVARPLRRRQIAIALHHEVVIGGIHGVVLIDVADSQRRVRD